MNVSSDRIFVSEIECAASIGVTDEERSSPQRLSVDVEVAADLRPAAASDDIGDAVDYGGIIDVVVELAGARKYHLLETLAEGIACRVLSDLGGESVRVLVRKLEPPVPARLGYVSVEVVRKAAAVAN